jgi:hypothetical protein
LALRPAAFAVDDSPPLLLAQSPLELGKITIEQGLPQGYVVSVCQDGDGFLWFGTNDGLCRYDGYEFLVFRHDPYDAFSISHNGIRQVVAAGEFLCVLTQSGTDLLDRKSRRFHHFGPETAEFVAGDGQRALYFLKNKSPIRRTVLTPEAVKKLRSAGSAAVSLPMEEVQPEAGWQAMRLSEDGRTLWLLKAGGRELCRQDLTSRQLLRFAMPGSEALTQMQNDGANGVWLAGANALAHFDATRLDAPWHSIRTTCPTLTLRHFDLREQLLWMDMGEICGFHLDLQHLPQTLAPQQAKLRLPPPAVAFKP